MSFVGAVRLRAACCVVLAALAVGCPDVDSRRPAGATAADDAVLERLVPGPGISAIAAGGGRHFASFSHVCAVLAGGLQCWGAGESGQLGDAVLPRRSPFPVVAFPPGRGVTAVAAGRAHTCALAGGRVFCWGDNVWRQSGPPRPFVITHPRPVDGLQAAATQIAAGARHSCAITDLGVFCWGANGQGQLGTSPCKVETSLRKCKLPPARVAGLAEGVTALALGRRHSCALVDGAVWCWGDNRAGQLGDGSATPRHTPAAVAGLPGDVTALAAGERHTCALAAGELHCWGANDSGQLGDGTTQARSEPAAVVGLPAAPTAVAAGAAHTCAASSAGVHCWGDGRGRQLDGARLGRANPRPVAAPVVAAGVRALAAGTDVSCALRSDERVQCWGDNDFGQLGSGDAPRDHPESAGVTRWYDGRLRARAASGRIAVACLGDSNTQVGHTRARNWCDRLADLAPDDRWRIVNRGEGGATAVTAGSLILASEHLDYTLENDAVDAVVLAYGTNDLLKAGATPAEVANAYSRMRQRAEEAGVDVFVGLTPPVRPRSSVSNAPISELNGMLRSRFPADRVIDFWQGVTDDDFDDDVHLGDRGQEKRARAAWEVLSAAAGPAAAR